MAWVRLAYKEFSLPFYYWKKGGCPGGRDFVWLTILITMILTFTLLSWGSYRSMLNRFVDILIGKVEGHGVPVLVIANPFTRGGVNLIDSDVLEKTEELDHKIHPYREVSASYVELLERDIWKVGDPGFNGWAVYADNPLWGGGPAEKDSLPLEIIINRSLFRKYFDYDLYRAELQKILPSALWNKLPRQLPGNDEPLGELWLRIRSGNTNEPLPFRIIWVDYIPTLEKVAFLFPLSTYHALSFANRYELNYFPEGEGGASERIKEVLLKGDINMEYLKIEAIKKGLRGEARPFRGNTRITFHTPVTRMRMDYYAERYNIEYDVLETTQGDRILHDRSGSARSIWLPVQRLPYDLVAKDNEKLCTDGGSCFLPLDVTRKGNGFSKAQIYIYDRTKLSAAVENILKVHDRAFLLTPVYQDALNRFGFLNRMVESMRQPYVVIFGFFLFALLAIHISTIVGHRRHRYGMLLSKGVNWSKLYMMLFLQVLMAVGIGVIVSAGILKRADIYLRDAIASVAADYRESLNVSDFTLIQLSNVDYMFVVVSVLIISLIFCTVSLFYMPLRPNTHPSLLFKE